jgi:hypothetical protein
MTAGWQIGFLVTCAGLGLFALTAYRRARDARRCGTCGHWQRLCVRAPWLAETTGICGTYDRECSEHSEACDCWRAQR